MSFRRLAEADKILADYTRYRAWAAKDSEERQVLYDGLNVNRFTYDKQTVHIAPFGIASRNVFVAVQAPKAGENAPTSVLLGLLSGYYEAAAPTGTTNTILEGGSLFPVSKLAKLTLKLRVTTATSKSPSRITGRRYFRHSTNSASMPFGKKAATDSYENAVRDIKNDAAFKTFNDVKGNSIIFTPEG